MKFLEITLSIGKETETTLFNKDFTIKNKHKYKLIYKNKIYSLEKKIVIPNYKSKTIKIKLIGYNNIPIINDIIKECKSKKITEKEKYKKNVNKYCEYLKCSLHELSKMKYKIDKQKEKIQIFGYYFANNNKDKCIIIYKDNIFSLQQYFYINDIDKEDNNLEILLIELKDIYDRSYMFQHCEYLEEFPLYKTNEKEILVNVVEKDLNLDDLEENEKSEEEFYPNNLRIENKNKSYTISILKSFSSVSLMHKKAEWNTCICKNMACMFEKCKSLISLPNISKWNTINVKYMGYMFDGC
mgnify:FL=1